MKLKKRFSILISIFFLLLIAGGGGAYYIMTTGGQTVSTGSLHKGLIAHYPLDSESMRSSTVFADMSGNEYHGTITPGTSAGLSADQHGQANRAYDFNGLNTNVSTTLTSNTPFSNGFTISVWVYPRTKTGGGKDGNANFIAKSNEDTPTEGFYIGWTGAVSQDFLLAGNGTSKNVAVGINLNEWVHIVATVNASNLVAGYKNGVYSAGGTLTGLLASITSSAPVRIGSNYSLGRTFNGYISGVRIYNRVLSTDEITQLYNSYRPKFSTGNLNKGLIAHYPLAQKDLRSTTVVADTSGNQRHATITPGVSAGFSTDRHGQAAKAYDFDNVSNGTKITLSNSSSTMINPYVNEFTVSFWIQPDWTYTENASHMFLFQNGYYKTTPWFSIQKRENGNSNNMQFAWGADQTTYVYAQKNNPTFFQSGQWVHIAITKTGANSAGTNKLYANGVLQSGFDGGTEGTPASTVLGNNFAFGADNGNASGVDGRVSDLRIYNRALSDAEVLQLYNLYE